MTIRKQPVGSYSMNPYDFLKSTSGRLVKTRQLYWSFLVNPLPPELAWSGALVTLHSEAERELARLAPAAGRGKDKAST
jgi:hypothetical protein